MKVSIYCSFVFRLVGSLISSQESARADHNGSESTTSASVLLRVAKEARSQTKLSVQPQLESVVPSARLTPLPLNNIAPVLWLLNRGRQFFNYHNSPYTLLLHTPPLLLFF